MIGLPTLAQLAGHAPEGWWWSTLTSRPALLLIAVAAGCLFVLLFMGWRLGRLSVSRRAVPLRQRFADDSGVAMIEFVLVTPVLLTVTLLLIQTVLVFTGLFYVQYAAYTAARSAIVHIPLEGNEPSNYIMSVRGSDKYDAIQSAAIFGVLPVSGREDGAGAIVGDLTEGVRNAYAAQGKGQPPWIDTLLGERLNYASNHTRIEIHRVRPGEGSQEVIFNPVSGLTKFANKEAVGVEVSHEFALSIPIASRVFALTGQSGTYTPSARNSDNPPPPGRWTLIRARAVLTNEGIDRNLPDPPPVPRI